MGGDEGATAGAGPRERTALVLSGGPHPFAETTPIVAGLLDASGYRTEVVDGPDAAAEVLAGRPPRPVGVQHPALADAGTPLRRAPRRLRVRRPPTPCGRPSTATSARAVALLALHAAPICFDDWPGWGDILGARWDWERSSHPPLGEIEVVVVAEHTITGGLDRIHDPRRGLRADAAGRRRRAAGRVQVGRRGPPDAVDSHRRRGAGGHLHPGARCESFEHPTHQRLLRQAIGALSGPEVAT